MVVNYRKRKIRSYITTHQVTLTTSEFFILGDHKFS